MKITKLHINNFLSIKEIEVSLAEKGLVLIQGENQADSSQDSNGAGKSSIPDAVSWCLYGITARGETGDRIVNRTAKKNTSVEIWIEEAGVKYRVVRYRKHKPNKNRLTLFVKINGSDEKELTGGTDAITQAMIEKILGCSQDVFCAAIYAGQDNMPSLPDMTDKHLKALIEESAGINQLDQAHTIAKGRLRDAEAGLQEAMHDLETKESTVRTWIETLDSTLESSEDHKVSVLEQEKENRAKINKLKSGLKRDAEDLLEKKCKVKESKARVATLDKKISEIDEQQIAIRKAEQTYDQAAQVAYDFAEDIKGGMTELKDVVYRISKIKDRTLTVCETCERPHDDKSTAKVVEKLKARAVVLQGEVKANKDKLTSAKKDAHRRSQTLSDLNQRKVSAHDLLDERDKLVDFLKDYDDLDRTVKNFKSEIETAKAWKPAEDPYKALIEKQEANLKQCRDTAKKIKKTIPKLEAKVETAKAVVKVYSPAGVRAYILDTVTPFLNERTGHYLTALTDGNIKAIWSTLSQTASKEIREKFSITVTSTTGADNFKGLSGGEKRKVRLATSMALQDLVATRATKPIELFIADEIDHALDEAGLERLTGILQQKSSERGTVLCISHNSLSDWISNAVTVIKKDGYSHLTGVALSV